MWCRRGGSKVPDNFVVSNDIRQPARDNCNNYCEEDKLCDQRQYSKAQYYEQ